MNQEVAVTGDILPAGERTATEWAEVIRSDLGRAVVGFIEAGQHLTEAKEAITHGGWEAFVKDEVCISPQTAHKLMQIAAHPAISNLARVRDLPTSWATLYELSQLDAPLLEAAIEAGEVNPDLERKQARALVIEYKQRAASIRFDVRHGDLATALDDIEAASVDLVLTDPPYPADFLPLYGTLSERAAIWLKQGGYCAVMAGQSYLPEVMALLGGALDYHWTLAYLLPGAITQIFHRKVNTSWKPILVYRNGEGPGVEWFGDVARSDEPDKRFHEWGQSESGMADLVKRLSRPGQLIADPFMGGGTTGVAALALGRSFVGCDVDADQVEAARERLEQTVLDRVTTSA